jgi:hypothetical protein
MKLHNIKYNELYATRDFVADINDDTYCDRYEQKAQYFVHELLRRYYYYYDINSYTVDSFACENAYFRVRDEYNDEFMFILVSYDEKCDSMIAFVEEHETDTRDNTARQCTFVMLFDSDTILRFDAVTENVTFDFFEK